jgi:hypothetical protein
MAKVNKLALVRLALHETIKVMDNRELLCLLADIYTGNYEGNKSPRWYGAGGSGAAGLEQGVYNYMTTFRRVSDLWGKLTELVHGDKDALKAEQLTVRNMVLVTLDERKVDLSEIEAKEAAAANE